MAGRAATMSAIPGLGALGLYWVLAPDGLGLVLLGSLAIVMSLVGAAAALRRIQRRPNDSHVARFIEERAATLPDGVRFDDALVTAVDPFVASNPAFGPLLSAAAVERLQRIDRAQIVPAAALRRSGLTAAAGALLLSVTLALAVSPLRRAADAAWLWFFPAVIQVDVAPGDTRVVAGHPVRIRAVVRAGTRVLTRLSPSLVVSAGGAQRVVSMPADGEGFSFSFESVDRTFQYKVMVGSAASREFTVTALFAPRVERIDLAYDYPSFTGLPPREEKDGGDIYAPADTRVKVRIHADKPVVSGEMSFDRATALALTPGEGNVLEAELVLRRDDAYRIQLADADGLRTRDGTEYFIRLMDDRPPDVRIQRPAGDQRITPLEEVPIEARAEDDYGISSFELVYSVPGGVTRAVPFDNTTGTPTSRVGTHLLAAEELGVKPGDVITYYARARDVGRGKRPTEARSDMYFLEVQPFGEEFIAAQSQADGGSGGAQVESLIAAQKEIINATWNVERRANAGRSARDIEDIAQAQDELKAKIEQLTTRRSRGRFDMPQQIGPRPSAQAAGDSLAAASQAMSRAVKQLRDQQTKDALPHEMAALQSLLQIQADIRRRQVMQQQANGASSGRSGWQSEDLSALFDKELQRQQRTNYETRSQLDERPDRADHDSALDRIRDLARRQEELSRRQRELADGTASGEERKRQLERLTREQNELRERVEELAKVAGGEPREQLQPTDRSGAQAGGQAGRVEQGKTQNRRLQQASEQMRSAAGDLGREDAKAAADRAERAAEQLRRLEQEMRGDSPEARRRAAGELQLEAQQIAEEQRRIAAEAGRLDRADGAGNRDARRRLAGDKERLAERTDALQYAASSMAKSGPVRGGPATAPAEPMATVARELEKQQLGARMRETAERMRADAAEAASGAAPPSGRTRSKPRPTFAEEEEQIARALDDIVERFAAGAEETRRLTSQLDQTREIRDRLTRLERRIAEAEAQRRGSQASGGRGRQTGTPDELSELDRLRQEYAQQLHQARETLSRIERDAPRSGAAGTTPETHEWSHADPGTQGYKQDFSSWQSLRRDIDLALERTEKAASARLAHLAAERRLNAGGSDRVPDAYRRLIARYYESLAGTNK